MDWQILSAIQSLQNPFLDALMPRLTVLGNAGIFWILVALVLLMIPKTRRCGIAMAIALLLTLLMGNCLLKPLIARPRPFSMDSAISILIPPPEDFSFPSGHTYSGIASAIILWRFNRKLGIPAMILAIMIAFTRLYLMLHFPSDIFGGVLLGILCAYLGIHFTKFIYRKNRS
ncbi:MAG: phosphatase PAP2 family protein [Clostridia bacterium]|nr:phosphatase PAP2 family protein [Clostridia bacterium]